MLVGQQLAVVRELPLDQARRERQRPDAERHLCLVHEDHERSLVFGGRGAPRLRERAFRHDRLALANLKQAAEKIDAIS